MIFRNLPGRREMASFLFPFDYHNIKVCLKAEILGDTPTEKQPADRMPSASSPRESKPSESIPNDNTPTDSIPTLTEVLLLVGGR